MIKKIMLLTIAVVSCGVIQATCEEQVKALQDQVNGLVTKLQESSSRLNEVANLVIQLQKKDGATQDSGTASAQTELPSEDELTQ